MRHFTRKSSAKRHNITVHGNTAEIVPYLEYLVGRKTGRYQASHPPPWYTRRTGRYIQESEYDTTTTTTATAVVAVTADSMREDTLSKGLQYQQQQQQQRQQRSIPTLPSPSSPSPMQPPQYPTGQSIHNPAKANDHDDEEEQTVSEDTKLKLYEVRWLLHKYPQFHPDPIELTNNMVNSYLEGDYKPLDDTLDQLRRIDRTHRKSSVREFSFV